MDWDGKHCMCGCGAITKVAPRTSARDGSVRGRHNRYVLGHHSRRTPHDYVEEDRGWSTPCWIWVRNISKFGYGLARDTELKKGRVAHRIYWERENGPLPDGMVLDHLCRVRSCVNPGHLEVVTQRENCWRGNLCKLTRDDVLEIRREIAVGKRGTARALAQRFGIAESTVSAIKLGRVWNFD